MLVQHMAAAAQHPAGFYQWCEQIYPYITDAAETGAGFFRRCCCRLSSYAPLAHGL
ncbi:hypothetical protein AB2E84_26475 (plasmid) [Escherichia coli]